MTPPPKKKVLFVITKSNYGGAQRYVFDLASNLPQDTYEPVVAFGGTGQKGAGVGGLATHLARAGIRTIPIKHFMRDMSPLREDVRAFFELVHLIRSERPDILHVTSSKAGGLGALAGRLARVPRIVFTSHGLTFDETWRPYWQRALIKLFTWSTLMLAHQSIMISIETCERARALPFMHHKVTLVYNGITPPVFLSKEDARKRLGIDSYTIPIIGTIAELHPNKNLHLIIQALAHLQAAHIETHLVLMGTGEEQSRLETLARECGVSTNVHFLGYVPNAATYLSALDIFVLPSAKEGLPYVLLEAGYAALPVVASDISGNRDIIVPGISGTLVEAHARAIAQALREYIDNPSLADRQGQALYTRVTNLFSIERMLTDTCALYACSKPATSRSRSSRRTDRS